MSKLRPPNAKYDVILAILTGIISEKESVQLHDPFKPYCHTAIDSKKGF